VDDRDRQAEQVILARHHAIETVLDKQFGIFLVALAVEHVGVFAVEALDFEMKLLQRRRRGDRCRRLRLSQHGRTP